MNVVVICLDTLRWDYLGCYGNTAIRTPAMDAFAQHAVRMDAAYCASFPTIPMRTDAFTGNVNWPVYGWKSLADDEITITELLREAGYYTAFVHDTSNMEHNGFGEGFDENIFITPPEGWESNQEKVELNVPRENMGSHYALPARDRLVCRPDYDERLPVAGGQLQTRQFLPLGGYLRNPRRLVAARLLYRVL